MPTADGRASWKSPMDAERALGGPNPLDASGRGR
jgi:hypothetical protein